MASLISALSSIFWNTEEAASPAETEPTDMWTVILSEEGKAAKIDELIHTVRSEFDFPISSTSLTRSRESLEIGMHQGIVLETTEDWKPITHLGSDIVVQMRGRTKEGTISHIGLVHLASERGIDSFKNKLEEILKGCEGKIELFIGGGRSSLYSLHQQVRHYIETVQQKHKHLSLADDCFGVTDLAEVFFQQNDRLYRGSALIQEAGFDDNDRPFMILSASFPKDTPEIKGGEVYSSAQSDYRIKV
ncbi:hypothetical protein [Simkania sp.]|uniref:hypothetical protein n=1 Tax=Simkania sp. TaxID=34094 RepID=UPI003B52824F